MTIQTMSAKKVVVRNPVLRSIREIKPLEPLMEEETLHEVLDDEIVQKFGQDGKLSKNQIGLVSTVVAKLLGRSNKREREYNEDLKREIIDQKNLFLAITGHSWRVFKEIYQLPFGARSLDPTLNDGGGQPQLRKHAIQILPWLNWGNFFAVGGAVILALSLYTTNAYSNYKDAATSAEGARKSAEERLEAAIKDVNAAKATIEELRRDVSSAKSEKESAESVARAKDDNIGDLQKQIATMQTAAGVPPTVADLQSKIDSLSAEVTRLTGDLGVLQGEKKNWDEKNGGWKKLLEETQAQAKADRARATDLQTKYDRQVADLAQAQAELASLKKNRR